MGKVVLDISMSVDGYIRAANPTPDQPLGVGGERLHEWAFCADEINNKLLRGATEVMGALISGRRTYDDSIRFWESNGPTGAARLPLFVITHEAPASRPVNGVYTYVTDGIESALQQARAAAGDKVVAIMGGANLGQQYLRAGLVDEIGIHLAPVLFGAGTLLFENLGIDQTRLDVLDVVSTPSAVHLRLAIRK